MAVSDCCISNKNLHIWYKADPKFFKGTAELKNEPDATCKTVFNVILAIYNVSLAISNRLPHHYSQHYSFWGDPQFSGKDTAGEPVSTQMGMPSEISIRVFKLQSTK